MAFGHGKDSVFQLDNSGGTLQNMTAYVTNVQVPRSIEMADTTTIGDQDKTQIPGTKGGTISVSALGDGTLFTHLNGIFGLAATSTWEWGPLGGTTGLPKLTGECRLTGWTPASGVGGAGTLNFELVLDGAQTLTTY